MTSEITKDRLLNCYKQGFMDNRCLWEPYNSKQYKYESEKKAYRLGYFDAEKAVNDSQNNPYKNDNCILESLRE